MFSYNTRWLAYVEYMGGDTICLSPVVSHASTVEVVPQYTLPASGGQRLLAVSDDGLVALLSQDYSIMVVDVAARQTVKRITNSNLEEYGQMFGVSACFVPWTVYDSLWPARHNRLCWAEKTGKEYLIYGIGKIRVIAEGMFLQNADALGNYLVDVHNGVIRNTLSLPPRLITYSPSWGILAAFANEVVYLPSLDELDIGFRLLSVPHTIRKIDANNNLLAICCTIGVTYVANIADGKEEVTEIAQRVVDVGWQGNTLVLLQAGNPMTLLFVPKEKWCSGQA